MVTQYCFSLSEYTRTTNFCRRQEVKKAPCNHGYSNFTLSDYSFFAAPGRYECLVFTVGDPVERKHGFSVNVM